MQERFRGEGVSAVSVQRWHRNGRYRNGRPSQKEGRCLGGSGRSGCGEGASGRELIKEGTGQKVSATVPSDATQHQASSEL